MARKTKSSEEKRNHVVQVLLTRNQLQQLDHARGERPRSELAREILTASLELQP